jgi:AraC-like DNA-binding protein
LWNHLFKFVSCFHHLIQRLLNFRRYRFLHATTQIFAQRRIQRTRTTVADAIDYLPDPTPEIVRTRRPYLTSVKWWNCFENQPWPVSEVADVSPNYYDQSHMIREFRQFAGITPGVYQARKRLDPRTVFTI